MRPEFTLLYKKRAEKKPPKKHYLLKALITLTKTFSNQRETEGLQENQWGWEISRA